MSNKGSKPRKAAAVLALTLACTMFSARTWTKIGMLAAAMDVCLIYALSGWITKRDLSIAERMGRSALLLFIASSVVAIYSWQFRPGWHLTSEQEDGLVEVAKKIPNNIVVLVELPENSIAGQEYGKDIMQVLKDNGVKVNSITVFYGVGETPVGLVISARYRSDPAYQVAGYVHSKMLFLKMPAKFQEGNVVTADATSFIIYVGSKPVD
jgi:hypothetical protein